MGLAAAGVQLGVGELAATLLPGARSPLTGMGRALIDLAPGPLVDVTVGLVEGKDKPLLMGQLFANHLGVGVVAGELCDARHRAAASLLVSHGLLGGAAAASRPDSDGVTSLAAGALGAGAGYVTLRALAHNSGSAAIAAAVGAGAVTGGLAMRRTRATTTTLERLRGSRALPAVADPLPAPPPEPDFAIDGLSALYTPNADFYETDVTFPAPVLNGHEWRLRIDGLVDEPVELSYAQLLDMELVEADATLICVHNPVGGDRIGTARWTGVPVATLLERVGVDPRADQRRGRPPRQPRVHRRGLLGAAWLPAPSLRAGRADSHLATGGGGHPMNGGRRRILRRSVGSLATSGREYGCGPARSS